MTRISCFLGLILCIVISQVSSARSDDLESICPKIGEVRTFHLKSQEMFPNSWPVVNSVPEDLRTPESKACHASPSTYTVDEAAAIKRDGIQQRWTGEPTPAPNGLTLEPLVVVDAAQYDTPQQAQNAVWYYIARYRFPLLGIGPHTRRGQSATVRPIRLGDVGYHIKYGEGHNFIFYASKRDVVLIDANVQAWESKDFQAFLKRLEDKK